jgi:hypothetical protein
LLDDIPLLAYAGCKRAPDLLAHHHILLGQLLQLSVIPFIGVAMFHETLMAFATSIGRLVGELVLDLSPVEPLGTGFQKLMIVFP